MGRQGAQILIVDDEPLVCRVMQEMLSEWGFDSLATTDPEEAQRMLEEQRVGLLLADLRMPKVSGIGVLLHARQHAPESKVIIITGGSSGECLAQALALGAYDFLEKPIEAEALHAAVSSAVAGGGPVSPLSVRAAEALRRQAGARQAALEGIQALVHAVEAKDPSTRQHSEHVAFYAESLSRDMNLAEEEIGSIRTASLVHDIGKIGVPDNILTKPGRLTEEEFDVIRRHPSVGADILSKLTLFEPEAGLVRHHHENWNGTGYPCGLAGEAIPRGARVIRVCDAMDAMLMSRTYKPSYSVEYMLDELARACGTQFDPAVARLAGAWCRANRDELITVSRVLV